MTILCGFFISRGWTGLTTGDFTNGAKILYWSTDLLSNILTLQLIRKKYKYIVPEFIKCMYEYSSTDRPRAASLIPWLVQVYTIYILVPIFELIVWGKCTVKTVGFSIELWDF